MNPTSTSPKNVLHHRSDLIDQDSEDHLIYSEILEDLLDAFDGVTIKAPEKLTAQAMAYSASHTMRHSEMLGENIPLFLN